MPRIQRVLRPRGSGSQRRYTRGTPVRLDWLRARAAARRRAALSSLLLTPHMTSNHRIAMIASHQGAGRRRPAGRPAGPEYPTRGRCAARSSAPAMALSAAYPLLLLLARVPCISIRSGDLLPCMDLCATWTCRRPRAPAAAVDRGGTAGLRRPAERAAPPRLRAREVGRSRCQP